MRSSSASWRLCASLPNSTEHDSLMGTLEGRAAGGSIARTDGSGRLRPQDEVATRAERVAGGPDARARVARRSHGE